MILNEKMMVINSRDPMYGRINVMTVTIYLPSDRCMRLGITEDKLKEMIKSELLDRRFTIDGKDIAYHFDLWDVDKRVDLDPLIEDKLKDMYAQLDKANTEVKTHNRIHRMNLAFWKD